MTSGARQRTLLINTENGDKERTPHQSYRRVRQPVITENLLSLRLQNKQTKDQKKEIIAPPSTFLSSSGVKARNNW